MCLRPIYVNIRPKVYQIDDFYVNIPHTLHMVQEECTIFLESHLSDKP